MDSNDNHAEQRTVKPETPAAQPVDESAKGQWGGAFAAYGHVFDQVKRNPQPALIIAVVYVLLSVITTVAYGHTNIFQESSALPELTWLIFLLALPVYALAIADKRTISNSEFFKFDGRKFLYILVSLILAGIIIVFSALLLLVPLIWTVAWYAFVQYCVADKGITPAEALKDSKRLAANHKSKVWGLIGMTILLAIPAIALTFIPIVGAAALALLQILATCAFAVLYRWLQREQPAA